MTPRSSIRRTRATRRTTPSTPTRARVAASKPRPDVATVVVETVNVPGYTHRVDAAKYAAARTALLRVLPRRAPGLTQAEMFRAVREHLPADLFPGGRTAGWWAKTVQLDLEAKGLVVRDPASRPLRWRRAR